MKTISILFIALALTSVLFVQNSFADESISQWDIAGGTSAFYQHVSSNGQGSHSWNVSGSGSYLVLPRFEAGLLVQWQDSENQSFDADVLNLLALGTFDFSQDTSNSFFVQAGIGPEFSRGTNFIVTPSLAIEYGTDTWTQFSWLVGIGKRFEIVKHLTWTPEVTWTGVKGTTDSFGLYEATNTNINVVPLQLSAIF